MNLDLTSICSEVVALAKTTAVFLKHECDNFDLNKVEHKSPIDLVSYVDKETEKKLVTALSLICPEAGFVTEEGTVTQATEGLKWIIDPLDGTTNFTHKLPPFSISIALVQDKEVLVGVVHEVILAESYYAWKGGGAWCNGIQLRVSPIDAVGGSLIAFGFPYNLQGNGDKYFELLKLFIGHSHGLRRLGSAAVDLAYVASGKFNAYFEFNLKTWDIAAGILLVQEAGGRVTDFSGGDDFLSGKELLATGNIHAEMLTMIQKIW